MLKKDTMAETIIKAINKMKLYEEEENIWRENNINNGVVIVSSERIKFERKQLYKISMIVPSDFELMDETVANVKYSDSRPAYIYTNYDATINLTLNPEEQDMIDDEAEAIKQQTLNEMEENLPGTKVVHNETVEAIGKTIPYFSFNAKTIDGTVHNIVFFLSIENKLVLGSINFNITQLKEMGPISKQMLESIIVE